MEPLSVLEIDTTRSRCDSLEIVKDDRRLTWFMDFSGSIAGVSVQLVFWSGFLSESIISSDTSKLGEKCTLGENKLVV